MSSIHKANRPPRRPHHRQRGAVLLVMLVIVVMGAATVLVGSLSTTRMQTARQETTVLVLAQAKNALLGYAAGDTTRPGELPCPDINDDGQLTLNEDYGGDGQCTSLLGRLPWKTLGLPDLRDAAGERLWYAISDPFHANSAAVLNSNTAGTLTVSGNISVSNIIAIVFAPGAPLCGQSRPGNNAAGYLEAGDGSSNDYILQSQDSDCSDSIYYNDNLLAITADQLFPVIERAVGKHFKNAQLANIYSTTWGSLPFASSQGVTSGLAPMAGNAPKPYWSSIQNIGDGDNNCSLRPSSCSPLPSCTIYARCAFSTPLSAGDTVRITGTINGVGMGFWRPYNPATGTDQTLSCTQEVCVRVNINGTNWYYPASSIMDNVQIMPGSLDLNGRSTFTFIGTVRSGWIPNRIQFSTSGLPDYSSSLLPNWFTANNWQGVMYYAVSPGYTPGAGNNCMPTPSCLTVKGNDGGNNKHAAIIMTGSTLVGQSRSAIPDTFCPATGTTIPPNQCISNYLELENATPANFTYENNGHSSTFNDQVIVIAP